jgi:hypothetical protein
MSVSYTLPASRTRPNASRRYYALRWLARRQDSRRLAVWGKTALWEVPTPAYCASNQTLMSLLLL